MSATWYNNPGSAASWYAESDPYFIRPEFGDTTLANIGEVGGAVIANELLGVDDFRRAIGRFGEGNIGGGLGSLATGGLELGLTALSAFGGPAGLAARYGAAAAKGSQAVPASLAALRSLYQAGTKVPVVRRLLSSLRNRRGFFPLAASAAGSVLGLARGETPAEDDDDDTPSSRPFVMNLPERGATGVAAVPGIDMSFLNNLMPISDYETLLDNELANIEARAGAYLTAVGTEWDRVRSVNLAAVEKAEQLGASAGEAGFAAWDRAARGALDVTETRNAALVQMAGGLPQDIAVGGAAEDFVRFASAAGASEQQLQETLGGNRAEDYRWLAEVADQTGAAYQGSIARAEQDAAAAAVARHNQAVIERNAMVAQMQFQAAMQQQQLATQASIANAGQAGAGSMEEVIGTAISLANRPGSDAGSVLYQLFPDVFPSVADAQGFVDSLGSANPFGG